MLYVNPLDAPRLYELGPLNQDATRQRIALQELEQYFARLLMREMRGVFQEGGVFPRSAQREQFEEMLEEALSAEIARSGQLGIAHMLEAQLRAEDIQKRVHPPEPTPAPSRATIHDAHMAVK